MRVRVRSVGPLPTVQAWYEVSVGILEQRTIADLKKELCQKLFNGDSELSISAANLLIEIDDFELLDSSSLTLIHENDLLV